MTLLAAVMERMKPLNMTLMMLINNNVLGFSLLDRGTPENLENIVKISSTSTYPILKAVYLPTRKHAKYTVVKTAA